MNSNNKIITQEEIVSLVKKANHLLKKAIQVLDTTQEQTPDPETVKLSELMEKTVKSINTWLKARQDILDQDAEEIKKGENNPYKF